MGTQRELAAVAALAAAALTTADSGSQKMQRTCETPSYAHLDNASTKEVLQKNSTDSCMGRRPMYKSDEFFSKYLLG